MISCILRQSINLIVDPHARVMIDYKTEYSLVPARRNLLDINFLLYIRGFTAVIYTLDTFE